MSWPSPIIEPRFSYRAEDVVQSLEPICCSNGYPKTIRVDQGSEFVSREMDLWAYANGVALDSPVPASQLTRMLLNSPSGAISLSFAQAWAFLEHASLQ
jgi:putative transposase